MNRFNLRNLRCFGLSPEPAPVGVNGGRNLKGLQLQIKHHFTIVALGAFGPRFHEGKLWTRRKIANLICLALLEIGIGTALAAEAQPNPTRTSADDMVYKFVEANQFYNEGNFQRATQAYEYMAKKVENGYLYFNLANCYFKLGRTGPAIVYYRRAERLIPYFENLAINLAFTRQKVKDKIEDKTYSQMFNNVIFFFFWFSLGDLIFGFLVLNTIFFLVAILRIYVKTGMVKWMFFILLAFYVISTATTLGRLYEDCLQGGGVVTAGEVLVRSGNGFNAAVLFSLHEGTEFQIEEVKGNWIRISLVDGTKGWVQRTGVEII